MIRLKFWIGVFGVWIYVRATGLYYKWSRILRWFVEHEHRKGDPPLKKYGDYLELKTDASEWKWSADTWRVAWDMISYPWATQARIDRPSPGIGDCDDWSMYLAWVLPQIENNCPILAGYDLLNFRMLTICYIDEKTRKYGGHNACLFDMFDNRLDSPLGYFRRYGHVSNWGQARIFTEFGFLDESGIYTSIEDIVDDICAGVSDTCVNLGWAVCDKYCLRTGEQGRVQED